MPARSPALTHSTAEALIAIGQTVRARRKSLRISAVAAAEGSGISNVTLFRIEKGEPSVTMGAYMAVFVSLGLDVKVGRPEAAEPLVAAGRRGWIPARVRLADYPVLQQLAWQVHGAPELTPREALDIYERNWRHIDPETLAGAERALIDALRTAFGGAPDV